jgi:hypothetical protein
LQTPATQAQQMLTPNIQPRQHRLPRMASGGV